MRVVMTILDSMPNRELSPQTTPNLWGQATAGGHAPHGGTSLMLSVTYSNHAAFVTGAEPSTTGLWGNHGWIDERFVNTYDAGPRARTLFDDCRDADRRTVAAVGDHKLITGMGALDADVSWPPAGTLPPGTPVDDYGYAADEAVIAALADADLDADFVLVHLNEPDTTLHVFGPESGEVADQLRTSDAAYGQVVELLQPGWDDTVLLTLSDHDQEPTDHPECIDLRSIGRERGWPVEVVHEGTGALAIVAEEAPATEIDAIELAIRSIDGIEGIQRGDDRTFLVWSEPRRMFGRGEPLTRGNHGSPRCQPQVAIVSGGHPRVPELTARLAEHRPTSLTWAPLVRELLAL